MLSWLEEIFFKASGEDTKIIRKAVLAGPKIHYGVFLLDLLLTKKAL